MAHRQPRKGAVMYLSLGGILVVVLIIVLIVFLVRRTR
jgi:hypothetical protein